MARERAAKLESFPDRVGRYRLIAPIGRGGLATVYYGLAEGARSFQRPVAVKLLHPHLRDETELLAHLFNEAKLVSRIRHPNVVEVIDVGEDPRGVYLVLEYIEGETLAGLIRHAGRERIPTPIALRIIADALEGLHAAHELADGDRPLGLVHRDFSPQNIIVGVDGITRLIDFGVAKAESASIHTRTGLVKGKVGYMSPEQARGHAVDRRTDVWAAGVVTWEVFAGRRLFKAEGDMASMLQIITADPPPLQSLRPDVPAAVAQAVGAALTRPLGERCPDARRLRELLLSDASPASSAEVSEYVQQSARQALEERKRRIAEFEERRAEMPAAIPSDTSDTATGQSIPESRTVKAPSRRTALTLLGLLGVAASAGAIGLWRMQRPSARATSSSAPPSPQSAPPPAPSAPEQPKALRISANAPIARLKLSGADVPIAIPAEQIEVEAPAGGFSIEAESQDGRRSRFVSLVATNEAKLEFPARAEKRRAVSHPTATQSGPLPLSPSPYTKR